MERLDPTEHGFEIDAYEEYDLYMKNDSEEEDAGFDLISIPEAIKAFEEVR